ncbi:FhaA domain-containing protein [Frankia sp. Cas4]|uniref:FhaA domain-containing protein n=1 Tax=Frankia sp. Cas4 TaxID=3073927 RepID=UPI002AD35B49|nr:FhaA domain-containing protein [Frankia sp. Cas4]
MGVLQRFERRLGGLVEGAFAKVFKGGVEPVEIASALARETDDRRAVSSNRVLVPNEFAVELAVGDFTRLAPYTQALCDELAEMVREHAAEQRYTFVGPVNVRLAEAEDLDVGVFRIRSSVAAADPGAVAARRGPARPRSNAPGAPRLLISIKPGPESRAAGEEREYPLDSETTVIGRSVECDIRLNDTGVSRRHGEVRRMPDGQFVYIDHGSTNGSIVNGRAASQVRLVDGDQIELGATILAFRREDPRDVDANRATRRVPASPAGAPGPYPPAAVPPATAAADPYDRPADPYRGDPRHGGTPAGYPSPPADPYRGDPRHGGTPAGYPPPPADPYRGGGGGGGPYHDDPGRGDPRRDGQRGGYPPPAEAYRGGGRPETGQPVGGQPTSPYGDPYGGGPRYDDPYGGREGQHRGGTDRHDPRDQRATRIPGPPQVGPGPTVAGPGVPVGHRPPYDRAISDGQRDPRRDVRPIDPDDNMHEQETYRPDQLPPAPRRSPPQRERPAGAAPPPQTDRGW